MKTLQQIDAEIAQLEQQLAVLHEQRREWVNYHDINKKLIRAQDFRFDHSLREVKCTHVPTGREHVEQFNGVTVGVAVAAHMAMAKLAAVLLAEGWVHAS